MTRFDQYSHLRQSSRVFRDGFLRRTAEVLSCLGQTFPSGQFRLLDIGTADGMMLDVLREAFPRCRLVGLESHLDFVLLARQRGHTVVCARADALPFADGSFDVVTIVSTLKHIQDYRATLSECHRTLASGGQMVVSDPTPFGLRLGLWSGHFERRYLPNIWSLGATKQRLQEARFEVMAAYRYMPLAIDLAGSSSLEALGRSLGLSSLFMQQFIHARSK